MTFIPHDILPDEPLASLNNLIGFQSTLKTIAAGAIKPLLLFLAGSSADNSSLCYDLFARRSFRNAESMHFEDNHLIYTCQYHFPGINLLITPASFNQRAMVETFAAMPASECHP